MSSVVYHYCSVETFGKIIANKELRLTDVTKSNDSKEIQLLFDYLISQLSQLTDIHNDIGDDFVPLMLSKKFVQQYKSVEQLFHVCCFSEDSDSLSQWSMYANDATGVAIGFRNDYFMNLIEQNKNMNFAQVKYSAESFGIPERIAQVFKEYKERKSDEDYRWYYNLICYVINEFTTQTYLYKHTSFKTEREYRLVYNSMPCECMELRGNNPKFKRAFNADEVIISPNVKIGEINFYVSRGRLVSYRTLHMMNFENAVAEVVIGSKSMVSRSDIEMMLIANGIHPSKCNIKCSDSSYQ